MEPIDVYWSFRSPYSYLVMPDLEKLAEDYTVRVNMRIVLPIAIRTKQTLFDASNKKPAFYIIRDSLRRAEFLGMPMRFPAQPDPVVQDYDTFQVAEEQPLIKHVSKLGVEAQRRGQGVAFARQLSHIIYGGVDGWNEGDHMAQAAQKAGLDLADLEQALVDGDHLDEIERNHQGLDDAGHWGVPTMVLRGEPFFGQDRVEILRWRLEQYGLRR